MNLILFSSEFPPGPGGIGTHAHQLALHLTKLGWTVLVIAPQDYASDAEIHRFNREQPFRMRRLRKIVPALFEGFYRLVVLARAVRSWGPEIILASGNRAVWLAALMAKFGLQKFVAIGHGKEFGAVRFWLRKITRWAFNQARAIVCVSRFTERQMRAMGIDVHCVAIIPNGADADRFEVLTPAAVAAFRAERSLTDADVLLTVGNVTERKGQDIVIRALPQILSQRPNTHYLIIGLPTQKADFLHLARELGVAEHVHFLGSLDTPTVVRYLNVCDVFVMTSRHTPDGDFEGYGIAVVEAALCGKPAVVSANSGLAEAVVNGETGFCVPQEDAGATAERLLFLLHNLEQRATMGTMARRRARAEQTWQHRAQSYDIFLRDLLQSHATQPQTEPQPLLQGYE